VRFNILNQMVARKLDQGKYADGQGLWLIKRDKTAGRWVLRLTRDGRRREMGLGRWPDVSIAEARAKAAEARSQWRDGIDPIEAKAKARNASRQLTVAEAIASCFESRKAELKGDGQAGRWLSPLAHHIIPRLGNVPIVELDQHMLKATLEPIWHARADAGAKALNRMNLTLRHATALGLDVDIQAAIKAKALLGKQRHIVRHIAAMPYADVPAFYQWLGSVPGVTALALRFLILTVARNSEVRLAAFDEIEGGVWTLAPKRTKSGKKHRVPLGKEALKVVEAARQSSDSEFLFPSYHGKPLSDAAMSKFMKDRELDARPHGFRAAFRTWVEEQTDTPFEVKEAALGHIVDTGVVGAYQRSDRLEKRRVLMGAWSAWLIGTRHQ
jgi:integrase